MLLEVVSSSFIQSSLSARPLLVGLGEDILSLKVEGTSGGSEDLLLVPPPRGLIDGIDPVLNLHHNASILGHQSTTALCTLGRLVRDRACTCISISSMESSQLQHTILAGTAVHLESLLIRVDIQLDARPLARQGSDGSRVDPVEDFTLVTIDNVAVVVTSAVGTAVAKQLGRTGVGTNLLGR